MFSGRTIGLPFVPTVGACTGRVVALASPRATKIPFNWARVLTHELVHVITLQQTEFNIPHWYTEALAVESEGFPRPQEWNRMLLERVPKRSHLLNLNTINLGFIRPNEPEDRQMAYCQAQLYARYMLKRFGDDALIKMLMAYRRGLTTDRAIDESFHVEVADFEKGYLSYLDEVITTIRTRASEEPVKFSQLERQLKDKPDDPDLNARMSYEHFARRDLKEARQFADKALKLKAHHPLASYVKAQLMVTIGDDDAARAILEPALDPKEPNDRVIDLLGELKMKAGQLDEAERLFELVRKEDPVRTKWISWLARIHLRQQKTTQFLSDLATIASFDADNVAVRKALAERHLARVTPPLPKNGPASVCRSTFMIRRRTSCSPTRRRPGRNSRRRSRSIRRLSSSRRRSPTTFASSWRTPSLAWAGATQPGRRSTAFSRVTPITPRPRRCASNWSTRPADEASAQGRPAPAPAGSQPSPASAIGP